MLKLTRIAAGTLIALALLLGIFAVTLLRRPAPKPVTSVKQAVFPVVVATRLLPAGKPIAADALRVAPLPINPNGAFADPSRLVGRVPSADIGAQSPVLEEQLSSGLAERIEPGERAVAVRVEEANAVGNRLRPGNFVDVFFTLKRGGNMGGGEIDRTQTRLLMSKIRVLAFGNATAGGDTSGDPNGMVRTAVLAVPVADIDRLTLAESSGRLVFALRNPTDSEVIDASAFAPLPAVLKTSTRAGGAAALQDSTRAAAGVSLDALSGGGEAVPRASAVPRRVAPVSRLTGNAARIDDTRGGIEVIRGGRAEMVAR
ncbi:Flp pilus assembly protein CpaB [Paraburkholderia sp. MPAMCS5]|uniref:Flp pilus assembly protein CpaB n=1 Tax=Paraburkholderia sp. MPAMCS5 TaxID=3112563 RepID=UPI002E16D6B6|nr:Flp pilus assembly protein CpaB [Paraburkholderia sp. MPAMCS5]